MNSNTQNAKIEAITETTLVIGIDVGSETHYARGCMFLLMLAAIFLFAGKVSAATFTGTGAEDTSTDLLTGMSMTTRSQIADIPTSMPFTAARKLHIQSCQMTVPK